MQIIEKIRKLLAVAEGQANENESAAAMAMAQRLMLKHGIEEGAVRSARSVVVEGERVDYKHPHYRYLAHAVNRLYGTRFLVGNDAISFVGRAENVAAAEMTYAWLILQVDDLYRVALPKGLSKGERAKWRKSFKLSCSHRVYERAGDLDKQESSDSRALVVHRDALDQEVAQYFAERGFVTKRARRVSINHAEASFAGRVAGDRVQLNSTITDA